MALHVISALMFSPVNGVEQDSHTQYAVLTTQIKGNTLEEKKTNKLMQLSSKRSRTSFPKSFVPTTLAQEITRRYTKGTAELECFIEHFSKRAQLEDALAAAIEKSAGWTKRGLLKSNSGAEMSSNMSSRALGQLVPLLQGEAEAQARMHLHLSERINNEVVRTLERFSSTDAWKVAREIEQTVQQMAEEMRRHHEQIPKHSVRTASKSTRSTQALRLEEEKRKLFELQQRWQTEISGLVDDFESADVARIEIIRESVFKFEHYRNEYFRAAQAATATANEAAQSAQGGPRIIDVVAKASGSDSQPAAAAGGSQAHAVYGEDAETKTESKGFLKLGIFRGKTARRTRKKGSEASGSFTSSEMSPSIASAVSPNIGSSVGVPSVRTTYTHDTRESDAGLSPGLSVIARTPATIPRSLGRHRNSFVSSHSTPKSESSSSGGAPEMASSEASRTDIKAQASAGDLSEWVFAGNTQEELAAKDDAEVSGDSLVHVSEHISPIVKKADESTAPAAADSHLQASESNSNANLHASGDIDNQPDHSTENGRELRFDDMFTPLELAKPDTEKSYVRPAAPVGAASMDLDSAFSVPQRTKPSEPAATLSAEEVLSQDLTAVPKSVPPTHHKTGSPGDEGAGHRRTASVEHKSLLFHNRTSQQDADSEEEESERDAFRVNFSIRDRAIRDNPDESKAALSRVATMLRAAPSNRRRGRREVRTVYVPPDAQLPPIDIESKDTKAAKLAFSDSNSALQPEPALGAVKDSALDKHEQQSPPLTPMPQRPDTSALEAETRQAEGPQLQSENIEALGAAEQTPETAQGTTADSIAADGANEEELERKIPVATGTVSDLKINTAPIVSVAHEARGVTLESFGNSSETNTLGAEWSEAADSTPGRAKTEPVPQQQQQQKGETLVRRRAPPPPPPPSSLSLPGSTGLSSRSNSRKSVKVPPSAADKSEELSVITDGPNFAHVAQTIAVQTQIDSEHGTSETAANVSSQAPFKTDYRAEEPAADVSSAVANDYQVVPELPAETVASEVPDTTKPVHCVRRNAGANGSSGGGRVPIAMHVCEVLDYEFLLVAARGNLETECQVTGEVVMHVTSRINPLELAPLRVCVKRPRNIQWVANPAVVVLDASMTSSMDDGREWYRFVRPDLFANVEDDGERIALFKYQDEGQNAQRVLPLLLIYTQSDANDHHGLMLFGEPNIRGLFAGNTVKDLALLLSVDGNVVSQKSRPTATWFSERNCLLWKLDPMWIPPADAEKSVMLENSAPLFVKVKGDGPLQLGPLALKFEVHSTRIVDASVSIVRVAAGSQTSVVVVDGPSSHVVKSGKCSYNFGPQRNSQSQSNSYEQNQSTLVESHAAQVQEQLPLTNINADEASS
ncbi:hypothetical protein COEREDRAFT_10625 [Coemansia reversa NRRL 1564]|uniref:MHD domain-containing protein n=1 Tax=Coemansia reversa (strain ATCC 12441 / NRRL 1564) TaxID=763665 RepID=A0A2G5B5K7_COERN|nr:hypothetical protein COEREDRAFT_10625 [Coemansia reversa NRRL 1564]|eukprot:PIA14270.1 hypothetical protein COEREDRAFT_10625 [Coemansia reversa NRRL 1564]